jgi:hypothetical protein
MGKTVLWHRAMLLPHPFSAARAREFVGHRLTDHDLPYLIDDVQLVASALATAAALHARRPFPMMLRRDECQVVVCLRGAAPLVRVQRSPQEIGARRANEPEFSAPLASTLW